MCSFWVIWAEPMGCVPWGRTLCIPRMGDSSGVICFKALPTPPPRPRTETAQFLHSLSTCLITRLIYPASDSKPGPAPRNSGPKGRQESNHYKLKAKAQVSKGAGGMGQWMKTVLCGNRALEMSSSPDPGRWELSLNRLPPHPGS